VSYEIALLNGFKEYNFLLFNMSNVLLIILQNSLVASHPSKFVSIYLTYISASPTLSLST